MSVKSEEMWSKKSVGRRSGMRRGIKWIAEKSREVYVIYIYDNQFNDVVEVKEWDQTDFNLVGLLVTDDSGTELGIMILSLLLFLVFHYLWSCPNRCFQISLFILFVSYKNLEAWPVVSPFGIFSCGDESIITLHNNNNIVYSIFNLGKLHLLQS